LHVPEKPERRGTNVKSFRFGCFEVGMEAGVGLDLRSGRSPWDAWTGPDAVSKPLRQNVRTRILIIGAGVTGSFLAEHLSRRISDIVVIDRHQPQTASTAASTSLLQWELDTPLGDLSAKVGAACATQIYRASAQTVRDIIDLTRNLGIDCQCIGRPSLYLAGNRLGSRELMDEQRQRQAAGLPSVFLTGKEILSEFGFAVEAALYSEGAAETNPVALAKGLMAHALARGVRLYYPESIVDYDLGARSASVLTASGYEIGADFLILANGYEMPAFVPSDIHQIHSTWAIATKPNEQAWARQALVWEASDPYLYARHNAEGRIILGGEDEELRDAATRDKKIAAKAQTLRCKFKQLYEAFNAQAEFAWSGFFGVTNDGLPLIGALPHHPSVFAAFGYGGNGITFSAMAARLLAGALVAEKDPILDLFRIDRD
jgi:glycine/D-amino acid oxidase-like deaminating enzyme